MEAPSDEVATAAALNEPPTECDQGGLFRQLQQWIARIRAAALRRTPVIANGRHRRKTGVSSAEIGDAVVAQ